MPAALFEYVRGVLAVLSVLFACLAGRSWIAVRTGRQRPSRLYAWILRAAVCAVALVYRQAPDALAIAAWSLAVAAFAAGAWLASRRKPPEDLTRTIFP